jgi:GABA permease
MPRPIAAIDPEPHRILLVGNETLASQELVASLDGRAADAEVLVVAPALDRRRGRPPDERPRRAAERRLAGCLEALREEGVAAEGIVGDAEPLVAIEDALRVFPADEIVIATHRAPGSSWLARRVVQRAAQRFWHPVHHVVVEESAARAAA